VQLVGVAEQSRRVYADRNFQIVAPLVSKHFDFLANLCTSGKLPIEVDRLKMAMKNV
jgi:hypothetical protein